MCKHLHFIANGNFHAHALMLALHQCAFVPRLYYALLLCRLYCHSKESHCSQIQEEVEEHYLYILV